MNDACGSHMKEYLPALSVNVHVELPVEPTEVDLFRPGPLRWKLWIDDLSEILNTYFPAFSLVTFAEPCLRVMVKPGPTVPVSVGVAASAEGTTSAATIAATATNFMSLLRQSGTLTAPRVRSQHGPRRRGRTRLAGRAAGPIPDGSDGPRRR